MNNPDGSGKHRNPEGDPPVIAESLASTRGIGDEVGEVELLGGVAKIMGRGESLSLRLRRVGRLLRGGLHADAVTLYLVGVDGHEAVDCGDIDTAPVDGSARKAAIALDHRKVIVGQPSPEERVFGRLGSSAHAWYQPIQRDGQLVAVLALERRTEPLDRHARFLRALSEVLATSIVDQHRFEELRRHATLAEVVSQVSRVALEGGSLNELLDRIVTYLEQRLEVTIASILLLDAEKRIFEMEVYSGSIELETPTGGSWPIDIGVCGRAVRTGEPQLLRDVRADPDYVPGNSAVRSEYIVPIRHRDEILGVLNLESIRTDLFTPQAITVFDHIADQIAGAIHLANLNRSLETANSELARLSSMDGLTGLENRRRFDEALAAAWGRAGRGHRWLSVILADLDCFKTLNDTHGHQYGDDCLRRVATVLAGLSRRSADTVARYGGEEFAVIVEESDPKESLALAEELRRRVERLAIPHHGSTIAPSLTISVGVASTRPGEGMPARVLLEAADAALYEAKGSGRNRVCERSV